MFQPNPHYPSRNGCFHSSVTEDVHEGTVICLECAVVLENQIFLPLPHLQTNVYDDNMTKGFAKKQQKQKEEEGLHILYELANTWHIAKKGVHEIIHSYKKGRKHQSKFCNKEILAYAVYAYLMKHEYNVGPNDIVLKFGLTNQNKLYQIASVLQDKTMPKLNTFVQNYASLLNLTFKEKQYLSDLIQNQQFINLSHHLHLKSLGVLLIIWFCSLYYPHYTRKEICKKCNVTYANIEKLIHSKLNLELKIYCLDRMSVFQKIK